MNCKDCKHYDYCMFYGTDCGEDFSGFELDTAPVEILPDEDDWNAINDWYEAHEIA